MGFDRIISNVVICAFLSVMMITVFTGAFNSHAPRISERNIQSARDQKCVKREKVISNGWLSGTFLSIGLNIVLEKSKFNQKILKSYDPIKSKYGTVIRTAAKSYSKESSEPTSRAYTTRKESRSQIYIGPEGVRGDYNHYRTKSLHSTPDRAVSILTSDVLRMLKDSGWTTVNEGDLGENIYVDGIDYNFFEVGKQYKFKATNTDEKDEGTVVEITERIQPCGNLCKLPYINDEKAPPAERFEGCKKFLLWLDQKEGLRGWYGKIIGGGGVVKIGDQVSALSA